MKKTILFSLLILLAIACGKDPIVYPIVLKLDTTDISDWKFNVMTSSTAYSAIKDPWDADELEEEKEDEIQSFKDDGSVFDQFTITSENKMSIKALDEEVEFDYKANGDLLEITIDNQPFCYLDINSDKNKAALILMTIAYKKAGATTLKPHEYIYTTPNNVSNTINTFISDKKLAKNDTLFFWKPTYNYKKS